ncbi:MAG TPA: cache domain-containing protein [Candidatus Saccharimonadales bacterium]|nr:cache domain-containing protein [Candidatus Saccharimonadales bacterium]
MARPKSTTTSKGGIRFWHKVLAALLVVGVVPIALVSIVSIQKTRTDLTDLGVTNIQQRSTSTAAALDAYLQNRLDDIVLVSRIPDVVRYATAPDPETKDAARQALKAAAARSAEYESVAVVDQTGKIAAASVATDEGTDVKFRQYFITPSTTGLPYISDPSYSVITNKPALFFSAPVKAADGSVLAVVRSRLNLTAIWSVVEADANSVGAGAHSFLLDDYGIRLAVSETKDNRANAENLIYKPIAPIAPDIATKLAADKRFGTITPDKLVIDPLPTLKSALDPLKSGFTPFAYGAGVAEQRGVATRLVAKPWAYVLAVPLATYTKAADDATFNAASVVAIGLLLSLIVGIMLTRSLVRPLRQLVGVATSVSTGDTDLRSARFDTREGDDITREVASAFDRLLNALRFYAFADEPGEE